MRSVSQKGPQSYGDPLSGRNYGQATGANPALSRWRRGQSLCAIFPAQCLTTPTTFSLLPTST
jgi:hypothetical protein